MDCYVENRSHALLKQAQPTVHASQLHVPPFLSVLNTQAQGPYTVPLQVTTLRDGTQPNPNAVHVSQPMQKPKSKVSYPFGMMKQ